MQDHTAAPHDDWAVIDRVWDLTQAIDAAGKRQDWIEAARLVSVRSPLLMSLSMPRSDAARDILRAIHAADQDVLAGARAAQTQLQQAYRQAMNSVQSVGEYQKIARF
ncbi:flagellar protein FliT [Burkholderia cenocepacia]|uniref:flagellar protein FliT n=1 Tax=Burkholderia cepacia complex TaxID=87882 RepID=UPI001B93C7A0|nr:MULTISPECIES: flagellar protein FliT [Burkholderia cepacia complex]MBR8173916.1 flagellar protein FliT [Burkholderia cenocepacia]MCO8320390.1 flagellar protein FliT [Burkholderia multivorans]